MTAETPPPGELELVAVRDLPAAPAEAWRSWTDPELLHRWWGPTGFTCPTARMDVRVGGTSVVSMAAPELGFPEMFSAWTYTLIVEPRRLEFEFRFSDAEGLPLDPQAAGAPPGVPAVVHHAISFDELGDGRTRMTVRESGYTTPEPIELSRQGLEQSLDKLVPLFGEDPR
ncbi:SRPBCC family protein [Micromonospora sp. DT81.3]|uniref:SRPBCC family protein n=1 Tax=Micromonospora sp. DT81.3 TaxID=3416523 RepID=UPI003CEB3516